MADMSIEDMQKQAELECLKANQNGRYSLFNTSFMSDVLKESTNKDSLKIIYNIAKSWEEEINIPYNIGVLLDAMEGNEDTILCIHRTKLSLDKSRSGIPNSEVLKNIMETGLINNGHVNAYGGSALMQNIPDLTLTMTPFVGLTGWINFIAPYKDNDVIILAAFPKAKYDQNHNLIGGIVDSDGSIVDWSKIDEIYDLPGDSDDKIGYYPRVKSECIIGAVLKKDNGLDEFYTRNQLISAQKEISKEGKSM